jgi:hypothetical protein
MELFYTVPKFRQLVDLNLEAAGKGEGPSLMGFSLI